MTTTTVISEERIIDMMQRIDNCVRGRLNQEQIEAFWMEHLNKPYWFRIFEVEMNLRGMLKKEAENKG